MAFKTKEQALLSARYKKLNSGGFAGWRDNEEVVKASIESDFRNYEYASWSLRDSKEVALWSIEKNWLALQFVSDRLKADKEVVVTALSLGAEQGVFLVGTDDLSWMVDRELLTDKEVVRLAVQINPKFVAYLPYRMKTDYEFLSELYNLTNDDRVILESKTAYEELLQETGKEDYDLNKEDIAHFLDKKMKLVLMRELDTSLGNNKNEEVSKKLKI